MKIRQLTLPSVRLLLGSSFKCHLISYANIVRLDNSEFSRNEDFFPSRLEAQKDATDLIFNAKTSVDVESAVGLMTMSGEKYGLHIDFISLMT